MGYERLLVDPDALAAALADPATHAWDLRIVAIELLRVSRDADAARVFDAIIEMRTHEAMVYDRALLAASREPFDAGRARRYLAACAPLAPLHPGLHGQAARLLIRLDDRDAAIAELIRAARRGIDIGSLLFDPSMQPLRDHPRWPEAVALHEPPRTTFRDLLVRAGVVEPPDVGRFERMSSSTAALVGKVTPEAFVRVIGLALADPDPRIQLHAAGLHTGWFGHIGDEVDDSAMYNRLPPQHVQDWCLELGDRVREEIPLDRVADVLARELVSVHVHAAVCVTHAFLHRHGHGPAGPELAQRFVPLIAPLLAKRDGFLALHAAEALHELLYHPALCDDLPAVRDAFAATLLELARARDSISDAPRESRQLLTVLLWGIAKLGARDELSPALLALASGVRVADDYHLSSELVAALGRIRNPDALPLLLRLAREAQGTHAQLAAVVALGGLHDVSAIDVLRVQLAATRAEAGHLAPRLARHAAISLLQLGEVVGTRPALSWHSEEDGRFVIDTVVRLEDAARRLATVGRAADAWREVGPELVTSLETRLVEAIANRFAHRYADATRAALAAWRALGDVPDVP